MNTVRVENKKLLKFIFGTSALMIFLTPGLVSLAADGDDVPGAAEVRSTTISTPAAKTTTKTTIQSQSQSQHAGAKVLSDDNDVSDDADKSKAETALKKDEVPTVDYTETAATNALCKQAAAYNQAKQYKQAIALLSSAITHDPRTIAARRLYAQTTLLNQEPDRSIAMLNLLAKYTKPSVFDKCTLGSAYYCKGEGSEARITFKEAVDLAPQYFYAEEGYIQSLSLSHDFATATSECSAALGRFKSPTEQAAIRKLYAKVVLASREDKASQPQTGDPRLQPPIPLQELSPYHGNHDYGG